MTAMDDLLTSIGAKHWWKMGEASSNVTSGGSVGGIIIANTGTPSYQQAAPGDDLYCVSYDGSTNGHSSAASISGMNYQTGVQAVVFNAASPGSAAFTMICDVSTSGGAVHFSTFLDTNGKLFWRMGNTTPTNQYLLNYTAGSSLRDGNWHSLVIRQADHGGGGDISMWLDGADVTPTATQAGDVNEDTWLYQQITDRFADRMGIGAAAYTGAGNKMQVKVSDLIFTDHVWTNQNIADFHTLAMGGSLITYSGVRFSGRKLRTFDT